VYFVNVSWRYWTVVFDRLFLPLVLESHWLEEFANFLPKRQKKMNNAAPPTLSEALAASQ
jgi:hypothetical protein